MRISLWWFPMMSTGYFSIHLSSPSLLPYPKFLTYHIVFNGGPSPIHDHTSFCTLLPLIPLLPASSGKMSPSFLISLTFFSWHLTPVYGEKLRLFKYKEKIGVNTVHYFVK